MSTPSWLRLTAGCALSLAALLAQAQSNTSPAPDTWSRVKNDGVLRIGIQEQAAPFSYLDAKGQPAGFSWEICRAVVQTLSAELKRPIEIKTTPVSLTASLDMLQAGRIDMQCGNTVHTVDRAQKVDFSNTFFVSGAVVSYRKDDPRYASPTLLGRVAVVTATPAAATVQRWASTKAKANIDAVVPVASYDEGMRKLKAKEVDTFVADGTLVPFDADVLRRPTMETIEPYALLLRKGDHAFAAQVDRALARVLASPAARQMAANAKLDERLNALTMEAWRRPSSDPAPQMR